MICKTCGAEVPNDKLYCEKCGNEINIVPYFEPEIETQMDESIHKISDEVLGQTGSRSTKLKKKKKHYLHWVIILVILSLVAGGIGLICLYKSPMYHVNRGNSYLYAEDYLKALECYNIALENNAENPVEIYNYMIKCYEKLGYDGKYEEYLLRVITNDNVSESDEIVAYSKLINLYIDGKSYQTINTLLKNCSNTKIVDMYHGFLVLPPDFSHEEGTYNEIIPLKILSPDGNQVFYTLNGEDPITNGILIDGPIFLEDGEYEIQAVCIDEHNVASDIVFNKYQVNFATR